MKQGTSTSQALIHGRTRTRSSQKSLILMTPPYLETETTYQPVTFNNHGNGMSSDATAISPLMPPTTTSSTGAVLRHASEVVYNNTDQYWGDGQMCAQEAVTPLHAPPPSVPYNEHLPQDRAFGIKITDEAKLEVVPKKRGRKRKNERVDLGDEESSPPKVKRGPGRPPRDPSVIDECHECKKIFKTADLLRIHRRIHTERTHVCEICQKSFHRPYDLKVHTRVHDGRKVFECSNCGMKYAKKQTLDFHLQKETCLRVTYPCTTCNRAFQTATQLSTHMKCHDFQQTGNTPGLVQVELKKESTGCTNQKLEEKKLEESEETRTKTGRKKKPKKIFQCEDCGLVLCSKPNLTSHVLSCHADPDDLPFECEVCGKKYPVKTRLNWHMKVHTGDKPHECSTCRKRFRLKVHLKVHIQTHTGELPFKCDFEGCLGRFGQKGHLRSHMRTHTGETPFPCKHCPKAYPRADILKRHVKVHHNTLNSDSAEAVPTF